MQIEEFRKFLNVDTDDDFRLIIAWILNAYNPFGPYLLLVLYGEQGSAKSMTTKVIRNLVDPSDVPLRREPRSTDDLLVMAKNNHIVAIDNMSHLSEWLSDDLCRLSTGGGLSKRRLYTDDEEIVLDAKRPAILNGIDEFVVRGDLASRTITLYLPVITDEDRKDEKTYWKDYESIHAALLGLIFDAVATGLRDQSSFRQSNPRMADAWQWISASETAFGWKRGTCVNSFRINQIGADDVVLRSSLIYPYLCQVALLDWSGTATDLLSTLNSLRNSTDRFEPRWPKYATTLGNHIRRIKPALKSVGIEVSFAKTAGPYSERIISIRKRQKTSDATDATSHLIGDVSDGSDAR